MRYLRLNVIFAIVVTIALTFGLGVKKADAGACKKMGYSNGCVTSADVKNNNLKAADLRDEAGADFSNGNESILLTGTDTTVRSVTITAPRPGVVIVNASGYFNLSVTGGLVSCCITTGSTMDYSQSFTGGDLDTKGWIPFGATIGYTVGRGSTTFNLVCELAGGGVWVENTSMTAIYVPTRY